MSEALKKQMREAIVSGLRRRTLTTCSRWARACVIMPKPYSGPINFQHHPWLLEMHDSDAPVNTGQKAAQMGFTVAAMNRTFFKIDVERVNCLYLLPTKTPDATDFTATRFNPLLELSPHLSKLFNDVDSVATKRAGSACLYIRGSNSRSSLKSIPVAFIVFDEYDEMNQDNLPMAQERMSGQVSTQQWRISTPTAPDFGINQLFLESTQEHFIFACPLCSRSTELIWPDSFVVCGESITDPDIKKSHLICKECKKPLAHEAKIDFLQTAKWEPTAHRDFEHRGFYINQMYSTGPIVTPPKIAEHYFRSLSSAAEEQEFFNQKMGMPHVVSGGRVSDELIDEARANYSKQDMLTDSALVTLGADIGQPWIHYEVARWYFARMANDINVMATCQVLDEGKVLAFEELDKLMRRWQVRMAVVDASPERRKAYEFAMRFYGSVKLCFYGKSISGKLINVDKDGPKISVDRATWLDMSLGRFHSKTIKLPRDVSLEYREHVKAPIRIYKEDANGNPYAVYVNSKPDHFAHARNYNEIALPLAASLVSNSDVKCFL